MEERNLEIKIQHWKSRLLDMTKRNRLLNFKTGKSTIKISKSVNEVFESLNNGEHLIVRELVNLEEEVNKSTKPSLNLKKLSTEELELLKEETLINLQNKFEKNLNDLRLKMKSSIEEKGVNTLYLACGFLNWYEVNHSKDLLKSPLFLIPIDLYRESSKEPFHIAKLDDDIVLNPVLEQKFKIDFGINLPPIDQFEVETYDELFSIYSNELKLESNWEITNEAYIGLFSFSKLVMYKDFDQYENLIKENSIIRSLAGINDDNNENNTDSVPTIEEYDRTAKSTENFQILDADSSQQQAILAAKNRLNFVMQGPPGTGKSQTIANIIAEFLALGKKVLFVSEKKAALEVVKKRIDEKGLGEYCLDLHNHNSNKKSLLQDLSKSLNSSTPVNSGYPYFSKFDRIKKQLNDYVSGLHTKLTSLKETPQKIHGRLAKLDSVPDLLFDINDVEKIDHNKLNEIEDFLCLFEQMKDLINQKDSHLWKATLIKESSFNTESRISEKFQTLSALLREINSSLSDLINFHNILGNKSLSMIDRLTEYKNLIISKPNLPLDWLDNSKSKMVDEVFEYYESHQALFLAHYNLKEELVEFYKEDILGADLSSLREILNRKSKGILELTDDYNNLVNRIIQEENQITSLINDTQKELDSLNSYLRKFYNLVGFNLITINKSQINLLNKVYFSIKDNPRPTEKWFENEQKDTIRKLIRENKEYFNEYNLEYEKFKGQYNPDLLTEDIDGILNRFINNYSSIFRIFKSSYKRDRNLLKSYQNQNLKQKNDEIIKSLRNMIKINKMKQEIDLKETLLKDFFGSHYEGEKTNWDNLTNHTESIFDLNGTLQNLGNHENYRNFIIHLTSDSIKDFASIKNGIEKAYSKIIENVNNIISIFNLKLDQINEEANILEYHFSKINTSFMNVIEVKRLVLSYYKGQSFLNTEQWEKLVNLIDDIKQKENEIVSLKDTFTNYYGDLYKGYETNWDLIEKAILWTTEAKSKLNGVIPPWFLRVITDSEKEAHFHNSLNKIETQKSAIEESLNFYQEVFPLKEPKFYGDSLIDGDISQVLKIIDLMSQQTNLLGEWTKLNKMLVKANERGLDGFLDKGKQLEYDFPFKETFQKRFYKLWLDYAYNAQPALKDFNTNTHNSNISEYKDLDLRLIDVNSSRINEKLYSFKSNYINSLSFRSSEISILKREIQKQKRHKPIRKLFSEIPGLLMALKPCMMMSPLSVSQYIDPSYLEFDLIIFDEASQIRPEDSVGSLFRGKQIIIAGDDKQLPPTAFFSNNVEIDNEFLSEEEEELYENFESILDECLLFMPQMSLKWHYRSKQESLIAFSNREIYNNELYTFPNAINQEHDGVSLIHVNNAIYDRGKSKRNLIEAQKVAELVFEHIKRSPDRSLGIIAFSEAQQEAIRDKIDEIRDQFPECESFFNEDLFESFFVKNLENVQGDERDTIILSIGYGKDENGVLHYNFGPLNKDGGERRLNVAITRARKELKVVSSILDTDMNDSKLNKRGPRLLKSYLAFAKSDGEYFLNTTVDDADFDSPFEEDVYNMLQKRGLELLKQVGCSGYRIDLAVVDPKNPGKYLMGIECDGATYHSSKTARDRDRLRQNVLESLGWNIQRIWSQDWVRRKKEITETIVNQINDIISEGVF